MKQEEYKSKHFGDQQLQMMRQKLEVPHLLCPSNKEVVNVCVNTECKAKNALFCDSEECLECLKAHADCELIRLKRLTALIQDRTQQNRELIISMLQKQNKLVEKIVEVRMMLVEKYQWVSLPLDLQKIINRIYTKRQERVQFSSVFAVELFRSLKKGKEEGQERGKMMVQQFQKEIQKIGEGLIRIKETLLEELYSGRSIVNSNNSNILKSKQSEQFVLKSLDSPKKMTLLFRASDHGFSALKFHQFCDGVPHTLTLLTTEYGKTLGGYTPLIWESPSFEKFPHGRYVADLSRRSFLLSLDLQEKMALRQPETAIFCHKNWGPYFGRGADLRISDNCKQDSNSYASVSVSYDCNGKYKGNQETWTAFCGAPKGSFFKILEYEVFRVEW